MLLILSEYVNKTEKMGMWQTKNIFDVTIIYV